MKYAPIGPQAILASAWGMDYECLQPASYQLEGNVASVMVVGPLSHHGGYFGGDTYDAIEARVAAALESAADVVVLKLDSPGGEGEGCFECARKLRTMTAAKGKRLVAYVDECAASAAYALACGASEIYLPASGRVGSVGVIQCAFDETAADAKNGLKVAVITSGARKADGNTHVALTPESQAEMQRNVDTLAALFFAHVAESRGMIPMDVQAMQAAMFTGADAVSAKLADGVVSWDALLSSLALPAQTQESTAVPEAASGGQETEIMTRAELLAALKAAMAEEAPAAEPAKEGDAAPMDAAGFKAALKALLAEDAPAAPPPHTEPDGDEAPAKAKAEAAPVKEEEKPAPAAALAATAAMAAMEQEAKMALLESRPDLDAKTLMGDSLSVVRRVVALTPRPAPKPAPVNPAAAAMVTATPGAGQVDTAKRGVSMNAELNARMGLSPQSRAPSRDGLTLVLPTLTPAEAEALIAARNGGK